MGVAGSNLLLHRPGMGKNFMPLTDFLISTSPNVYNKFRAVSSSPRHSGIHHSPAGDLCLEARVGRTRNMEGEETKAFGISLALTAV